MSDYIVYGDLFLRRVVTRLFCAILFLYGVCQPCAAQHSEVLDGVSVQLPKAYSGSSDSLLAAVMRQANVTVSYSNKVYAASHVSLPFRQGTLRQFLDGIFARFPVDYIVRGSKIIVAPAKRRLCALSGYCRDAITGEALIGAHVYDTLLYRGSTSNDYGFFSVALPSGKAAIRASFVGYHTLNADVPLNADTIVVLRLMPAVVVKDIEVVADRSAVGGDMTGTLSLPMEQVKNMPSLMGESDVIKALQHTPGVQSGEEGFGGMSVRGGAADQNIVLLDDVPLYNANHLMGLYTVFNSESVNSATLVKGGFPARYGGRLSSVLDVKTNEGHLSKHRGYVNVGLLASNGMLEGPIIKDKMSFIVTARRTYFDLFSAHLQRNNDNRYAFFFYDLSAKLNWIASRRDRLYVSFFAGYDHLRYDYNFRNVNIDYGGGVRRPISLNDDQRIGWGSLAASVRWNHVYGASLFSNVIASFSRYRFRAQMATHAPSANDNSVVYEHGYYSGLNDVSVRADFTWYTPFVPGTLRFGASSTYHAFYPGVSVCSARGEAQADTLSSVGKQSFYRLEFHSYAEDEFHLGPISANVGVHLSSLLRNDNTSAYMLEPRLLVGYKGKGGASVKFGYSEMSQFMQQLRIVSVASPADMWLPTVDGYSPPHSHQWSVEATLPVGRHFYLKAEAYRKRYDNIQTNDPSQSMLRALSAGKFDNLFCVGRGRAKGIELFVHKQEGRISGWLGYTWSRSDVSFDKIASGRYFPADNDRRHSLTAFGCYKFTPSVDIAAMWTFNSGAPTTISDERFSLHGNGSLAAGVLFPIAGERNAYRLPNSHMLNLGVNIRRNTQRTERVLSFGIYNAYARKNPMFVYWGEKEGAKGTYELKQFSLIAWPWPYVKYSIRF